MDALHHVGITEVDAVPAAPSRASGERCKPARLSAFIKEQLKKVVDPKDLELLALDAYLEDHPDTPEPEPEADPQADTDAMLVDHELRISMLEIGLEVE